MEVSKKDGKLRLVEFNGKLYGIGVTKVLEGKIFLWDEMAGEDGDWVEVVPAIPLTKKDKEVI